MWLVNDDGFFSTVQDYKDSEWVYVRARSETDVEAFAAVSLDRFERNGHFIGSYRWTAAAFDQQATSQQGRIAKHLGR